MFKLTALLWHSNLLSDREGNFLKLLQWLFLYNKASFQYLSALWLEAGAKSFGDCVSCSLQSAHEAPKNGTVWTSVEWNMNYRNSKSLFPAQLGTSLEHGFAYFSQICFRNGEFLPPFLVANSFWSNCSLLI